MATKIFAAPAPAPTPIDHDTVIPISGCPNCAEGILSGTYMAGASGTFGAARIASASVARYRFTGNFDFRNQDYSGCDFHFSGFAVLSMDGANNVLGLWPCRAAAGTRHHRHSRAAAVRQEHLAGIPIAGNAPAVRARDRALFKW
jgi:hypothetical protein